MHNPRHLGRRPTLWAVAALFPLLLAGCQEFEGVQPPLDALFFPQALVLHPDGQYLYVVNTNFDVSFNQDDGGTVTVVDTDTFEILSDSTVQISSFGGEAVLSEDARFLYIAVRGDNSIVRLDVSTDGSRLSCRGGRDSVPCRMTGLGADPFALAVQRTTADLDEGGETDIDVLVVSHLRSSDITALSIKNEDLTTTERVSTELIAGGSDIETNPRTGDFYATGRFDGRVRAFSPVIGVDGDIAGLFGTAEIPLVNPSATYDARGIAFSSDGNRAYVIARAPNTLLVIDTSPTNRQGGNDSRDQVIDQIDLLSAPEAIAVVEEGAGTFLFAFRVS